MIVNTKEWGSFLDRHVDCHQRYYGRFANEDYYTTPSFSPHCIREVSFLKNGGRLGHHLFAQGYYARIASMIMAQHRQDHELNTAELAAAEGVGSRLTLDCLSNHHPQVYPTVNHLAIDYAAEYEPHQKRCLQEHLASGRVTLVHGDATELATYQGRQLDHCFAFELLDDLKATDVHRNNGTISALRFRRDSGGWGGQYDFFPLAECEDRDPILAYLDRNKIELEDQRTETIHLGIEELFTTLEKVMKPNSTLHFMDYFYRVPDHPYSPNNVGLWTEDRKYPLAADITALVNFRDLATIAKRHGFQLEEVKKIKGAELFRRDSNRHKYFYVTFRKIIS